MVERGWAHVIRYLHALAWIWVGGWLGEWLGVWMEMGMHELVNAGVHTSLLCWKLI